MGGPIIKDKAYYFYEHALHDSYVYYKSLLTKKHPMARRVAGAANKYLFGASNMVNNTGDISKNRINSALKALGNAAANEELKEQEFLESMMKKLNNCDLPEKPPDISTHPYEFTAFLNECIKGKEQFRQELNFEIERLRAMDKYGKSTSSEIHKAITEEELDPKNLLNLYNTLEGMQKGKKSSYTAFKASIDTYHSKDSKLFETIITKYADKLFQIKGNRFVLNGAQANIIVGLIISEIKKRVLSQKEKQKTYTQKELYKIINDINADEYLDIVNHYTDYSKSYLNTIDSIANTLTDKKTQQNLLSSKIDHSASVAEKRLKEAIEKQQNRKKARKISSGKEKLIKQMAREMAENSLSLNGSLRYTGAEIFSGAELTAALMGQTIFSGSHAKDDIGTLVCEIDVDDKNNKYSALQNRNKQILAKIFEKERFNKKTGIDYQGNMDRMRKAANDVLKELEKASHKLNEDIEQLEKYTNAFIIHGNVKSYNTIGEKTKAFSGGSIGSNLETQLSNFATLMSYAGYGTTGYDQDWLLAAAINTGPGLIGEANKEPLQKYLSSMMGLLLFGDAYVMAEESAKRLTEEFSGSTATQIHLYNLNGNFVPCSFVLKQTYDNLSAWQANQPAIENYHGVEVKISAPGAHGTFPDLNPSSWDEVKANAIAKTNISINFMANFLSYLSTLNKALSPQ